MNKFNVGDKVSLNGEITEVSSNFSPFTRNLVYSYRVMLDRTNNPNGRMASFPESFLTLVEKAKPVIKVCDRVNLIDAITNAKKTAFGSIEVINFKVVDIIGNEAAITWNDVESGLCCRVVDIDKLTLSFKEN